ncbi:hypothetical protein [Dyadobacter sp. LHD-138]|uniref:hypothetical protein n=1 Tax=Dyadobacter sp. LHD-138 TaxID=3071413 RepID=UPI0027E0A814|nr:hypothetical protein [Dyadobacter sp. LHD-138]MDQ6478369.1 hypothetical protein [Dyadobacter sp. LHD-138]
MDGNDSFEDIREKLSKQEKKILLFIVDELSNKEIGSKLQLLQTASQNVQNPKDLENFVGELGFENFQEYSDINSRFVEHLSKLERKFNLTNVGSPIQKKIFLEAFGIVELQKRRMITTEIILQDLSGGGSSTCSQTWERCHKDADAEALIECGLCMIAFEAPPILGVCILAAGVKALSAKIKCDRAYNDCCILLKPGIKPLTKQDLPMNPF